MIDNLLASSYILQCNLACNVLLVFTSSFLFAVVWLRLKLSCAEASIKLRHAFEYGSIASSRLFS